MIEVFKRFGRGYKPRPASCAMQKFQEASLPFFTLNLEPKLIFNRI